MEKTIGGDRLGAGKKMKVELHGYERSTHDMGYLWRSTMSAGTLVPFLCELALPGDTFDIDLNTEILTHPTVGPLFGSYKVQLDVFQAPIRLYQGLLHNNALGIGLKMANVKLPIMTLKIDAAVDHIATEDVDNSQINPSCILSYLGIRGVGIDGVGTASGYLERDFNALPLLMYWDVYKNYYADKQLGYGYTIYKPPVAIVGTVTGLTVNSIASTISGVGAAMTGNWAANTIYANNLIQVAYTGAAPKPEQIIFETDHGLYSLSQMIFVSDDVGVALYYTWDTALTGYTVLFKWRFATTAEIPNSPIELVPFQLDTIDEMRNSLLSTAGSTTAKNIGTIAAASSPYDRLLNWTTGNPYISSQAGLGIKTYQSDLFNNWINTDWIDGSDGINAITAIDTSTGQFTLDTLNLSKKVYDMLNRIAISGGSYDDWLDAVYTHDRYTRCSTPIYHGGLIKELIFQEVVSNSAVETTEGAQALGTLAGRGKLSGKHKGGQVTIKVDEPSYIMGIISLTPRVDYSQGNKWDTHLLTMDDLHKPALDQIGFQELITEQMAWFGTVWSGTEWLQTSAGKQPAWLNYMTNVNQTRGNFAIASNEMFMTLNRKYEHGLTGGITDVTTYIDPAKYNNIFAETQLDSQNFWAQIAVNITARRKMSAKIMPNL